MQFTIFFDHFEQPIYRAMGNPIMPDWDVTADGQTFVFAADPQEFTLVTQNKLGDEVYATLAVSHDQVFMRVAHNTDGSRQEMLYCIGH